MKSAAHKKHFDLFILIFFSLSRATSPVYFRVEHIFTCKISARIKFDTDSNAFAWCFFFSFRPPDCISSVFGRLKRVACHLGVRCFVFVVEFETKEILPFRRCANGVRARNNHQFCAPALCAFLNSKRERHLSALTLASRGGVMAVELVHNNSIAHLSFHSAANISKFSAVNTD